MTLKERREQLGLNQDQAAELVGLKQSYYSRVERGKENPTIGVFERLADLYDAEVAVLVREWLEVRGTIDRPSRKGRGPGYLRWQHHLVAAA